MANETTGTGYSYSFNLSGGPPQDPVRWIWQPGGVHPLGGGQILLRDRHHGTEVVVRQEVLDALQRCRRFRTLDEHVQAIVQGVPALAQQSGQVRQVLETLSQRGVLTRADSVLERLGQGDAVASPPPVEQVVIRTCDRPELLARLLDSLRDNQTRHGRSYRYLVLDDSRRDDARQRNAQAVQAMADRGLNVVHYGDEQRRRLGDRLSARWPAAQLDWLLEGTAQATYGRNWNHALLLTAGRRFLLLDDDVLCRAYQAPESQGGLGFGARNEDLGFFHGREAALHPERALELDPLAQHDAWLGRRLRDLVSEPPQPVDTGSLVGLTPEELAQLGPDSVILTTGNGVLDDPGMGSMHGLYLLRGQALARFTASAEDYRRFCDQRHLWRGYTHWRVLPDQPLMSTTLTGIDNRRLLPPTLPQGRGEDLAFGGVLKCLYPNGVRLQFPWCLPHLPASPRQWDPTALEHPLRPHVGSLVQDLSRQFLPRCHSADPAQRLKTLGALYREMGEAPQAEFRALMEDYQAYARSDLVRQLVSNLQAHPGAPAYWREDMQRMIHANSRPPTEAERYSAQELDDLGETLRRYGLALSQWAEVWEDCRRQGASLLEDVLT